jgi:hypothetical protein
VKGEVLAAKGKVLAVTKAQLRVANGARKLWLKERGEEMQTAGRSWADIVGSQNLSQVYSVWS